MASALLTTVILLTAVLIWKFTASSEELCTTTACIEAAHRILQSIDNNTDPCDNFYQFACGKAIGKMIIPADERHIDMFSITEDLVANRMHSLLTEPAVEGEIKPFSLAKKYFRACSNEDRVEEQGEQPLKNILKGAGGWPLLEYSWNETEFDWTKMVSHFLHTGLKTSQFLSFSILIDEKNSSRRTVWLDQPQLTILYKELYNTPSFSGPYYVLMQDIAVQLGASEDIAKEELATSLEFERQLANLTLFQEERENRSSLYNPMSIKKVQEQYPETPWLEFINSLLPYGSQLSENDTVIVAVPSYFGPFERLIKRTPKRVQANYALWTVIESLSRYLPRNLRKHFEKANRIMYGAVNKNIPRWKDCMKETLRRLPVVTSAMYIRKYYDEKVKVKVTEIVDYIQKAFKTSLKSLDWMDDETRQRALYKAQNVEWHIGHPSELLDNKTVENYYENLSIDENDYLQSYLNVQIYAVNVTYPRLHQVVNRSDWRSHPKAISVGATYFAPENSIHVPAGILQETFFNKDRPKYLNYGSLGFILGHELTHGFDNDGRQFDANGNLNMWWQPDTEESFRNKTLCVVDQYSNFFVPEINETIDGILTQGESIADNGGIKLAYTAYDNWVREHGQEPKLLGLSYSPRQLFWIAAATNWCGKYRKQYLRLYVRINVHPPNEFRVLGPFRNSGYFSRDFNCPRNSRMNPEHKCSVWTNLA